MPYCSPNWSERCAATFPNWIETKYWYFFGENTVTSTSNSATDLGTKSRLDLVIIVNRRSTTSTPPVLMQKFLQVSLKTTPTHHPGSVIQISICLIGESTAERLRYIRYGNTLISKSSRWRLYGVEKGFPFCTFQEAASNAEHSERAASDTTRHPSTRKRLHELNSNLANTSTHHIHGNNLLKCPTRHQAQSVHAFHYTPSWPAARS